jgi:deazaflavin-dependent oxidoreductase (nitroreductase family)
MSSESLERLARTPVRQTLSLTHYGRKSGRSYEVILWYLVDGDRLYLVTANKNRNWVRNVKARPKVSLRIGDHIFNGEVRPISDPQEREHVSNLVEKKYWYVMPLLRFGRMLSGMGVLRDNSAAMEVILS